MIKIILPTNQNLLSDLTDAILQDVCNLIFNTKDYLTESELRRNGRYIKVVNDETDEVHYVCFSNPNNNSRNAQLMQFVSPAYVAFYKEKAMDKHLDIYLINPSNNDRTNYIKMFYRCFLTIGISVLNIKELGISAINPFNSYEDLKSYRKQTSDRNTHNSSTYFTDDDDQVSIFGKTFGANAMESFILGLTIKKVVDRTVVFYPVIDNEADSLSDDQCNILANEGLIYGDSIELLPSGYAKAPRDTSRNTTVFHYNLLQKFGDKRCYLCGCDLEHLVIGAHIERIADIDRSNDYTIDQKIERATDGDNGIWLCANHDKMFEYGIIYFDQYIMRINSLITDKLQQSFIKVSVFDIRHIYSNDTPGDVFEIKQEHRSDKMLNYISKHLSRHSKT